MISDCQKLVLLSQLHNIHDMRKLLFRLGAIVAIASQMACADSSEQSFRGPIVMGDSSTIVTETNPEFLSSNIEDFKPIVEQPEQPDTIASPNVATLADTTATAVVTETNPVQKEEPKTAPAPQVGLEVPFADAPIFISGIQAKVGNVNWAKAKSASYTIQEGELQGQTMRIDWQKVNKVAQRLQTAVVLRLPSGRTIKVPGFSAYGSWHNLTAKNKQYNLTGMADRQLRYEGSFSPAALRKAVQKWARNHRMSKKEEEKLLKSIRNVDRAGDAPTSVALQSVVWKISGTNKKGQAIERELRLDHNL